MGISLSHLPFYDLCHSMAAIQSPVFVLGSQEIHEPVDTIRAFATRSGHSSLAEGLSVRALFRDRYSVETFRDCDLNDKADLTLDISQLLPSALVGSALTVLNSGTIEHVFDIASAFRTIHELSRAGGVLLHCAPLSWHNHGFYNLTPRVFAAIAEANGYSLIAEAFHFPRGILEDHGQRPTLHITFDGHACSPIRSSIMELLGTAGAPVNVLYMVAHRKILSAPFAYPYDIQT
jgi:hypothetical protein